MSAKKKILIVDDDAALRQSLAEQLRMYEEFAASEAETFLVQELRDQIGRFVFPVHRLDRAASGVIVFAFSSEDAALLQETLHASTTSKEYLTFVRGIPEERFTCDIELTGNTGQKLASLSNSIG